MVLSRVTKYVPIKGWMATHSPSIMIQTQNAKNTIRTIPP